MRILERLAFDLTEEQRLAFDAARAFARAELAPGAAERDRTCAYPAEQVRKLAELGLLAVRVPVEDGGAGADSVTYALTMAALAESDASTAVILSASNMAALVVARHGTAEQRARWLPPYARGELGPISFALSEPHCGSDASALRTTATRVQDGWEINGSKMWITSGAVAGAHVVFARTRPGDGPEGITCFLVEAGTPGCIVGKEERKMSQRASGTVALHFDGCRVPDDARIGPEGRGMRLAFAALDGGRVGIAGLCLGIAEAAFREGVSFAMERRAFGQRVIDFQNSRFVLADSRMELDAAWLLTLRAARLIDQGCKASAEASMAKLMASEVLGRVVDRMLQFHGGYGISEEYPIERYYRDARVTRIYEGSSEIQRLIIARELVRELE